MQLSDYFPESFRYTLSLQERVDHVTPEEFLQRFEAHETNNFIFWPESKAGGTAFQLKMLAEFGDAWLCDKILRIFPQVK